MTKLFIWNPGNCECKCDKSCDIGEYLDLKNCECRKRLMINYFKNVVKILMEMNIFIFSRI